MDDVRVDLLGVKISAINMPQALAAIDEWIAAGISRYVCVISSHPVMAAHDRPELRTIYNSSGLTTPDGMPLVWWLHWHGQRHVERVYGPDLLLAVCQHSVSLGYRHFFYGGAPGVAEELAARLQTRFPGLQVAGCWSPPFRPLPAEEDAQETAMLAASGAQIIWVGIGAPQQDQWMSAHCGKVGAAVLIGVGAAFDFHSGRKRQAPVWIQHSGFEWFYRLIHEPGRLWRRYLLLYPRFVVLVALQAIRELFNKVTRS
jgi:N-acetylglucosaminyldiphosphoundecaprenol N-acetyl-beta-D-mannosaminyltransferase